MVGLPSGGPMERVACLSVGTDGLLHVLALDSNSRLPYVLETFQGHPCFGTVVPGDGHQGTPGRPRKVPRERFREEG